MLHRHLLYPLNCSFAAMISALDGDEKFVLANCPPNDDVDLSRKA
jgi:hypothetical protein